MAREGVSKTHAGECQYLDFHFNLKCPRCESSRFLH
jgi:hypothetical protein